jgi:hypothetical protein
MLWASDDPFESCWFVDQNHTAVATDIFKNMQVIVFAPHKQERATKEFNWRSVAWVRNILSESN